MRPIPAQVFFALSLIPFTSGVPSDVLGLDSLRVEGKDIGGSQTDETFHIFIHSTKSNYTSNLHLKSIVVK